MKSSTALLSLLALASGARATILPRENAQGLLGEPIVMETKVPVVLGVMSACPDALACEAVFDRVLKQVGRRVDLGLTFVAKYVAHIFTISSSLRLTTGVQGERNGARVRGYLQTRTAGVCGERPAALRG